MKVQRLLKNSVRTAWRVVKDALVLARIDVFFDGSVSVMVFGGKHHRTDFPWGCVVKLDNGVTITVDSAENTVSAQC